MSVSTVFIVTNTDPAMLDVAVSSICSAVRNIKDLDIRLTILPVTFDDKTRQRSHVRKIEFVLGNETDKKELLGCLARTGISMGTDIKVRENK